MGSVGAKNSDGMDSENRLNDLQNLLHNTMNEMIGPKSTTDIENNLTTHIYRNSNDGSKEFLEAKQYIMDHGRGLGDADNLTPEQKRIVDIIEQKAVATPVNTVLYRTDDTNWLSKYNIGDRVPINSILQATTNKSLVINENEGNVVQKLVIDVPKGTKLFTANNGGESQLDVVKNQFIRIIGKHYENGVAVYDVIIEK